MTYQRICTCGHPEAEHYRGECTAINGAGLDFCSCSTFVEAEATP